MRLKHILFLTLFILILSCQKRTNNPEFIEKITGRYLYNSDEVIDVYFDKNELYMKWRGADKIYPLQINDTTFFVKEMNEKIQFLINPVNQKYYMIIVPKEKNTPVEYFIKKIKDTEIIPSEYLKNNELDNAISAYLLLKKTDSLDLAIREDHLNSIGYKELRNKNYDIAINYFKVNIALYPKSPNVYDSLGDAYRKKGDTLQAITNYEKSLLLDSSNSRIKKKLKKLKKE